MTDPNFVALYARTVVAVGLLACLGYAWRQTILGWLKPVHRHDPLLQDAIDRRREAEEDRTRSEEIAKRRTTSESYPKQVENWDDEPFSHGA